MTAMHMIEQIPIPKIGVNEKISLLSSPQWQLLEFLCILSEIF
jgi:hypothetical protein